MAVGQSEYATYFSIDIKCTKPPHFYLKTILMTKNSHLKLFNLPLVILLLQQYFSMRPSGFPAKGQGNVPRLDRCRRLVVRSDNLAFLIFGIVVNYST